VLNHLHRLRPVAVILEFLNRETEAIYVAEPSLLIQHNQTFALAIRERAQQHSVNHAENGRVGADAEG
jgi:hypothetical protein